MTIKDICPKHRISQSELSRRYGIPLRTVQDWHSGIMTPPPIVAVFSFDNIGLI